MPAFSIFLLLTALLASHAHAQVDYDIVYVKQPRNGDNQHMQWPEVFHPAKLEPNSDLVLLHPDGTEETLVDTEHGAVTDPFVSFDGQWVYYSLFHDVRPERLNHQRGNLPLDGADIFKINLTTREVVQLTFQEFTPNTGSGNWDETNPVNPPSGYNRLGYGIINSGPAPIAGGKIVFTSSRNGFKPVKSFTNPNLQLFVMDEDGKNVTAIAPMTLGSALHPTPLMDGRIMFSSYESQGLRDRRNWGIWSIWPDGRNWAPIVSSFKSAAAFHFMTQLGDGDIVVEDYYNLNNFGFGALYRLPSSVPAGQPAFYSAFPQDNPAIEAARSNGERTSFKMPFTPKGLHSITPFTNAQDQASPEGPNGRVGKFTHPSAAPDNHLLVVWSGGPVNRLNRPVTLPAVDSGIYVMLNGGPIQSPDELILIKNDPNFNEAWPRAVVSYDKIYGVSEPKQLPWLPNDGSVHAQLPAGTAYGLIGTSSFYKRETFPGIVQGSSQSYNGLDVFNTSQNGQSSNWSTQGADAGLYTNADIWAVRILAMEPNSDRGYGPNSSPNGGVKFYNHANERLRILGEIPLRKFDNNGDAIIDPEGHPDTSFLAKLPADTPFTFQTLDKNGLVLNMSQTWHQVRPGEARHDCGGCHAHSQQPLQFEQTAAAGADYEIENLAKSTPLLSFNDQGQSIVKRSDTGVVDVEFYQDIRPILQRSCVQCHTQTAAEPPAQLVLDDYQEYDGLPGDYKRLCSDANAQWGIPPVVKVGSQPRWRQTNASRYVRKFQSRRSLLIWKIYGERLDGWNNEDHPTETLPGDATTLPVGASANEADLDFIGDIMPPPNSDAPPLSMDEKITFARWIDLGCPIDTAHETESAGLGWFLDENRPTLTISEPVPGNNPNGVQQIRIGIADANSGVVPTSLSMTADFTVAGRQAGAELADLLTQVDDGIYEMTLNHSLPQNTQANVYVSVADAAGNITRQTRTFYSTGENQNRPPVANISAEANTIRTDHPLALDGNFSFDPDDDPLSFQWEITSDHDPNQTFLMGSATSHVQFVSGITGVFRIQLTVSDGIATGAVTFDVTVEQGTGAGELPKPIYTMPTTLFSGDIADTIVVAHETNFETHNATFGILFTPEQLTVTPQGLFSKDAQGLGHGHISLTLEGSDVHLRMQSLAHETHLYARNVIEPSVANYVAVSLGDAGLKLYINGKEAVSVSSWVEGLQNNLEALVVGASQDSAGDPLPSPYDYPYKGTIHHLNIYDAQLTASDIASLACEFEVINNAECPTGLKLNQVQTSVTNNRFDVD